MSTHNSEIKAKGDASIIINALNSLRELCRNGASVEDVAAAAGDFMFILSMPGQLHDINLTSLYSIMHNVFNEANAGVLRERINALASVKLSRLNLGSTGVSRLIDSLTQVAVNINSLSQFPDLYTTCMYTIANQVPEVNLTMNGHKSSTINYTYQLACSACIDIMLTLLNNIIELASVMSS